MLFTYIYIQWYIYIWSYMYRHIYLHVCTHTCTSNTLHGSICLSNVSTSHHSPTRLALLEANCRKRSCGEISDIPPLKTNMEPENDGFLVGISSSGGSFWGSMLVFGGVFILGWLRGQLIWGGGALLGRHRKIIRWGASGYPKWCATRPYDKCLIRICLWYNYLVEIQKLFKRNESGHGFMVFHAAFVDFFFLLTPFRFWAAV